MSKWDKYKEKRKQWRKDNPEKTKIYRLREKCLRYGITHEEYLLILEDQNNTCGICGNPETRIDNRSNEITNLAIDHCHVTEVVRGLLCSNCNVALGLFKDNPDTLFLAYEYLIKHKKLNEKGNK